MLKNGNSKEFIYFSPWKSRKSMALAQPSSQHSLVFQSEAKREEHQKDVGNQKGFSPEKKMQDSIQKTIPRTGMAPFSFLLPSM